MGELPACIGRQAGRCGDVTVRVPLIPDYNTDDDRAWSVEQLQAYGFERFDKFTYRTEGNRQ